MNNQKEPTRKIDIADKNEADVREIMRTVYSALEEKGYNPVSQIVGYILSEDPTYITTNKNARSLVRRINRYELLSMMLNDFMKNSDSYGE
ncbi:MAG: IreB family regulatory phosphoprotein [Clostridia bacterium]|nr:IreB family regulatory phosphoprotein [Clostridia bacterium]MBR2413834.1 IreB family regulatory phosphoprotein [Clostridia bacterium]MBR3954437.1 IreB family regulatory phosphoprotein [Clostridia bacterium]